MKRRLLLGSLGAIAGALIGAIAWAAITAATHFQIGYMAIGVGFLAGYGMRTLGGGRDRADGVIAGIVAFLGCVLGNLLTAVIDFAPHDAAHRGIPELTLLILSIPKLAWFMLTQNFSIMDLRVLRACGVRGLSHRAQTARDEDERRGSSANGDEPARRNITSIDLMLSAASRLSASGNAASRRSASDTVRDTPSRRS